MSKRTDRNNAHLRDEATGIPSSAEGPTLSPEDAAARRRLEASDDASPGPDSEAGTRPRVSDRASDASSLFDASSLENPSAFELPAGADGSSPDDTPSAEGPSAELRLPSPSTLSGAEVTLPRSLDGPTIQLHSGGDAPTEIAEGQQWPPPDETVQHPAASTAVSPEDAAELAQITDYRLLAAIGRGGMGVVYRAIQLGTGREVALKTCHIAGTRQPMRFIQEAQIAARLDHPNIARVFDARMYGSIYCYAMELVHGLTLDAYLKFRTLTLHEKVALIIRIARAVALAHANNIVHRDLKMANVMVDEQGEPKVLDFGLAKAEDSAFERTLDGTFLGTPGYMSPEQAQGEISRISPASDVFSLGVIMYLVFTGRHPFQQDGLTPLQVMARVANFDPPRPRSILRMPLDLEAVILKATAKPISERYPDASALADDLQRFLDDRPVLAHPRTGRYVALRAMRRHALSLAAILAATILLAVAAVGQMQDEDDRAAQQVADTADHAATQLRSFFDTVEKDFPVIDQYARTGIFDPRDMASFTRAMAPLMSNRDVVTSINTGDAQGNGLMILQLSDHWKTREVHREDPAWGDRIRWQKFERVGGRVETWEERGSYDPRTRPWYRAVAEEIAAMPPAMPRPRSRENTSVPPAPSVKWTAPYKFATTEEHGITASIATSNRRGRPLVIAVDVLLKDLSRALADMHSPTGPAVMILSHRGAVVAMSGAPAGPKAQILPGAGTSIGGKVMSVAANSPVASSVVTEFSTSPDDRHTVRKMTAGGRDWRVGYRPFRIASEQQLWIAVIIPQDHVIGHSRVLTGVAVAGSVLLLLGLALPLYLRRR